MRFGILGPTKAVRADGRPLALGGPRQRALLARLLVDAGRVVTAQRLIDSLYGDRPPAGATNALQSQVSRLRRALRPDDGILVFLPAGYRLDVGADDIDAHRFERLAVAGRQALADGDPARAADVLGEALDLWRGPALADVDRAPFAAVHAARLEELRLTAVQDHVEAELALGRHAAAVARLQALVAAHPLRERLRGQLMRALHGSDRRAEALAVFADARRRLADELGVDPSAGLAATHLAILRDDRRPVDDTPAEDDDTPPPAGDAPARPGGIPSVAQRATAAAPAAPPGAASRAALPAQLTSFVGRAVELDRLGTLLGAGRLVTLTGPGGAGKTRLAVEAAARQAGEVCFVELAPLTDAADVPYALLTAVGARDTGMRAAADAGRPPPDPAARLVTALTDRRPLLVLDNCEHVIDAVAALIGRLLSACPGVRVLATSREALGITGETLCPVPPLALPPPGEPLDRPLDYAAVRLFAERAAAVHPGFAVDRDTTEPVVRICRALDGLPLAIELAAARLRSLPVGEVADRLDDRFRLLSRGSRAAPVRHRTLRAVVEWSWDLLDDSERVLARRLAVFAGGATLAAVRDVCGLPADEAVDALTGLVDKSFVDGGPRYRMLDTIRVFCAERLTEAGEEGATRHAHAAYFLDLALTAEPRLRRADQLEWLARLDAEHDDLHGALRWAARAEPATALRLVSGLSGYWWLRGLRGEGAALAAEVLDAVGPAAPAGLAEEYAICQLNAALGEADGRRRGVLVAAAEPVAARVSGSPRNPFIVVLWAMAAGIAGAERAGWKEPGIDQPVRDPWFAAMVRLGQGFRFAYTGDMAAAEQHLTAALAGFRRLGDRWGCAVVLGELAKIAGWRGDRTRARTMIDEAIELTRELGANDDLGDLLRDRAAASLSAGDLAAARLDYEGAAALARRTGAPETLAHARHGLAEIARLRGDLAEARRQCGSALAVCPTDWFGAEDTRCQIWVTLGRIAEAQGDADTARAWHHRALAVALRWMHRPTAATAVEGLAGVALLDGAAGRAALLLGAAAALRGTAVAGQPDVARVADAARAACADMEYDRQYRRGATMTVEQVLAAVGAPPSADGAPPSVDGA